MRLVRCLTVAIAALGAAQALAQSYPTKPIRLVVGITVGSPTDVVMRAAAQELQSPFGQPVIIDNRPGGNNMIAPDEFVRLFRSAKFSEFLENQLMEIAVTSPQEFAAIVKQDRERAGQIVKKYNIPRQ